MSDVFGPKNTQEAEDAFRAADTQSPPRTHTEAEDHKPHVVRQQYLKRIDVNQRATIVTCSKHTGES